MIHAIGNGLKIHGLGRYIDERRQIEMWNYEKRLQYPVHITKCDPKAAMIIMSQYGGAYSITHKLYFIKRLTYGVPYDIIYL